MVKLYEDTNIKAIADAIRAKNGTETTYKPSEMAAAISAIETGGNIDALLDRSITEIDSNITTVGKNALCNCASLTTANFPFATKIESNALEGCSALETINAPLVTSIASNAFLECSSLQKAEFPLVRLVETSAFYGCKALEIADIGSTITLASSTFRNCYILKAVILRSSSICIITSNAFSQCYHMSGTQNSTYNPNGLADGYIYVPSALVGDYQSENSSYVYKFRALENYTVDGTTTGAFDESKI